MLLSDFEHISNELDQVHTAHADVDYIKPNSVLNWYRSDSIEEFNIHLQNKEKKALLELNGWLIDCDKVKYHFNSKSFRYSEDFKYEDDIVFLGCSHTLGAGLIKETTWTHILAEKLKCNEINLGWSNQGSDYSLRMAYTWLLNNKKPKYVIHLVPSRFRFEYVGFTGGKHTTYCHYHQIFHDVDLPFNLVKFYNMFMDVSSNTILNRIKNSTSIEWLCTQLNIPCFSVLSETTYERIAHSLFPQDYARDLMHFGIKTNNFFANRMYELINSEPNGIQNNNKKFKFL